MLILKHKLDTLLSRRIFKTGLFIENFGPDKQKWLKIGHSWLHRGKNRGRSVSNNIAFCRSKFV